MTFDFEEIDIQKVLSKKSTRHHYIPQFLINGFVDKNKLLHVYDIERKVLLSQQKSPKAIFWEKNRNTIKSKDSIESSIIEDLFYSRMDNEFSQLIIKFQNQSLSEIVFTKEDIASVLGFLVMLYWRIPKTDLLSNYLYSISNKYDENNKLDRESIQKIHRSGMFDFHIKEILKNGRKDEVRINIHQSNQDVYLIGDNPILFRKNPEHFNEFNDFDFLFAVSSNRIYSSTNQTLKNFNLHNSIRYNAGIINQSKKYVACSNLDVLKQSVKYYEELKRNNLISTINELVFHTQF